MNRENNYMYINQDMIEKKLVAIENKLLEHNKKFDEIYNILFFSQSEKSAFEKHHRKNS